MYYKTVVELDRKMDLKVLHDGFDSFVHLAYTAKTASLKIMRSE
jgi:hypothetical protein